jgi:serine/threonine protein kinase/tetratricopeptide (TPR) repeat protein
VAAQPTCPVCGARALEATLDLHPRNPQSSTVPPETLEGLGAHHDHTPLPDGDRGDGTTPETCVPEALATGGPQSPTESTAPPMMEETLLPPSQTEMSPALAEKTPVSDPSMFAVAPTRAEPTESAPSRTVGIHIPGYTILSELGRGGMGVVYKARQLRANRLVALKMILAGGHASGAHLERFRIEGEAVARLHHPNIVQVYEVAEHEGHPYFSLEFLNGGCLADRLDGTPWVGKDAAALVEKLARAMQHAHDRGIVHRDLKPANVLLAKLEPRIPTSEQLPQSSASESEVRISDLIPKVSDFGLAKQMESHSGQTHSGDVLGTPSYMAPEQAEGNLRAIGPATDIYALGAILYELLTGRPPFLGTTLLETLEQVRLHDPVAPRQLHFQAPHDLETICLKCLQKEPGRRYASALELAEDLRRFQVGEPIKARPVGTAERVYRWGRRNPKVAGLLAALVLVTVAGFIAVSVLWRQAESQRRRAEDNLLEALGAVDLYFTSVSEHRLLNEPGSGELRRDLLLAARDYYVRFVRENEGAPGLQAELGRSQYRLGQILGELDSPAEGIKYHQRALAIFKRLANEQPKKTEPRFDLASTFHQLGRLLRLASQTEESKEHYEEALIIWEELGREHPEDARHSAELARTQMGLGNLFEVKGQYAEAQTCYEKALKVRHELVKQEPRNENYLRDLAVNYDNLAVVHDLLRQPEKSDREAMEAQKILERLAREMPAITRYQNDLARSRFNAGNRLALRGEAARARATYQAAAATWRQLGRDHPLVALFEANLAAAYHNEGDVLRGQEKLAEAGKLYEQALTIKEQLVEKYPEVAEYQYGLALAHRQRSDEQGRQGKETLAREGYEKARGLLEKLTARHADVVAYQSALVGVLNEVGLLHHRLKDDTEAEKQYRKGLKICDDLSKAHRHEPELVLGGALCRSNLADLQKQKPAEAVKGYIQGVEAMEELLKAKYRQPFIRSALRKSCWGLALALEQQGEQARAEQSWQRALELSDEQQKKEIRYNRAVGRILQASADLRGKEPVKALAGYAQAIQELEGLLRDGHLPPQTTASLRNAYRGQALSLTEQHEFEEALKAWARVLELAEEKDRPWFRLHRLNTLAQSGAHAQATQEAESLLKELRSASAAMIEVAGIHALAADMIRKDERLDREKRKAQTDLHAARAMELLEEAEKKGWFKQVANGKRLQEKAFDALRDRGDFQMLQKRLGG